MNVVEALFVPLGWALRNRRPSEADSITCQIDSPGRIALTSPAFTDGAEIPARYCGPLIGKETSPPLAWSSLPPGTVELLLVFEDVDVPRSTPALHTVALFPPRDGLAEGALTPTAPDIRFLPTMLGRARYFGPRPLPGHGTHRYRFHLYALDTVVEPASTADLPAAVAGHVLANGLLVGTRTC